MLTSSYKKGLLAFSIATGIAGCIVETKADKTGQGESEHTTGQPVALNNPYVWAKVSDADFGKGLSSPGGGPTQLAPQDDIATVRINQWLDRYHSLVGTILSEHGLTLVAPKPSAAIFKQYGPNAWVSPALACPTGWTLRPLGGSASASRNLLLTEDYAYGTDVSSQCISPQNWTDKSAFASFFNSQSTACRLGSDGDMLTVSGMGCNMYGSTAPMATYAVSSTISVTMDAITWGSESRVADTLAHELGHYYRAHANPTVKKQIDFFYRDQANGPDRPVPANESAQYEQIVQQIRAVPAPIRIKQATRYSKRLAYALYNLRGYCPSATITEQAMRGIMSGQITTANANAYLAFEGAIQMCATSRSVDPDALTDILRQSRIYLPVDRNAPSLDASLTTLTNQINTIDSNEAMLIAKMGTGLFGWYTEEQEADEIGLELAARAGIDPKDVINNNVHTYEQLDALYKNAGVDRGDEVTMVTCKKWLAAGFTEKAADGTTQPVKVPIGGLSDPHHDGCYRVYNMWREAKRHQYVVASPLPTLSPDWSAIQAHTLTLGGTKPPATDSKGGDSSGTGTSGNPAPNGSGDDDDEKTPDPEDNGPPPRKPRTTPTNGATTSSEDSSDAGVSTVTKTSSACAQSPGSSGSSSAFGFGLALALGLTLRRRASTSSKRRA